MASDSSPSPPPPPPPIPTLQTQNQPFSRSPQKKLKTTKNTTNTNLSTPSRTSHQNNNKSNAKKNNNNNQQQQQQKSKVNLLELAAASLASTILASRPIRTLATTNTRIKSDGSPVTAADGAAQRIISDLLHRVSNSKVRIVGEECQQDVESGSCTIEEEVWMGTSPRSRRKGIEREAEEEEVLYGHILNEVRERRRTSEKGDWFLEEEEMVDPTRLSVFIDPLDGTSSYTKGDYESVTILVGVILDNVPIFGVIGHPFGRVGDGDDVDQRTVCLNYSCAAVYGGTLIGGAFTVGGQELKRSLSYKSRGREQQRQGNALKESNTTTTKTNYENRKAIISKSRSGGVVQKCINALANRGLLHRQPIHITGAGYKTMRLLLGDEEESLWFFPKPGTSLWDMAAADALLRVMGGKVTDKFGKVLDYSKEWTDADNLDGIVACSDLELHAKCIQLFEEEQWKDD